MKIFNLHIFYLFKLLRTPEQRWANFASAISSLSLIKKKKRTEKNRTEKKKGKSQDKIRYPSFYLPIRRIRPEVLLVARN